jgi:hypothetical protein
MLTIHGKDGQHASDIQKRWLFENTHQTDHAVIVPISATRYVVSSLLQNSISSRNIVNFSGVMNTSPNGIHNIHFLFWPNATGKLSVATTWDISLPGRIILDNAQKNGIHIIETTREEHDEKMAIIQWLSNFLLILIWESDEAEIQKWLIDPWKTTENTIKDMIFQNSPMEIVIKEFFDQIKKNSNDPIKTFWYLVNKYITSEDMRKFSTPNFKRIIDCLWNNIQLKLSSEYIDNFKDKFQKNGYHFIWDQVRYIRTWWAKKIKQ